MRLITINDGKEIINYKGYLRVGINNNFVDNGFSGNAFVGFDQETGRLFRHAHTDGYNVVSREIERHPQTLKAFEGFEIPHYQEACHMVRDLHRLFRQFFIVGWDIGLTEKGPIVIEGNNIMAHFVVQVLYGGARSRLLQHLETYRDTRECP
jgi:hypothetical protein